MNASMMNRIENAQYALIQMSTHKLINDRRPLTPPVKPVTFKLADIASVKVVN